MIVFSACHSNKVELPSVQGMIYDGNNEPVSDVEIFIDEHKNAMSDIYGHFTLTGLKLSNSYTLKASKKGYEGITISFTYSVPSQVIYLHMNSAAELLSNAESMVKEKKYKESEKYLVRSEQAGGSFLSIYYLRACIKYNLADYEAALSIMTSLLDEGYADSYIYLLLADIYEFGFSDIEKAKLYLKKSLDLSYDPIVQKRLDSK